MAILLGGDIEGGDDFYEVAGGDSLGHLHLLRSLPHLSRFQQAPQFLSVFQHVSGCGFYQFAF